MFFYKISFKFVPTIKKHVTFVCSKDTYNFYRLCCKKFLQPNLEENSVFCILYAIKKMACVIFID
jgi:hypothetical protein